MQKIAQILQYDNLASDLLAIVHFAPQPEVPMHVHPFHELVIVFGGTARHVTDREEYTTSAGDVFLIRPGEAHRYTDVDGFELVNILYYWDRLQLPLFDLKDLPGYHAFFELEPEMRHRCGFRRHLQVGKTKLNQLALHCRELSRCLELRAPGHVFSAVAVLMNIMACVAGSFEVDDTEPAPREDHALLWKHSRVLSDVEQFWNKPFELEDFARRHGMSSSTLYRNFIRLQGKSPLEYLLELRVARAAELLLRTDSSVAAIAVAAGFRDSNYFARCFRQRMGVSPSEYRKRGGTPV